MPMPTIDYTKIDFESAKSQLIEYVKKFYPQLAEEFKDSDAINVVVDLFSFISDILSFRTDAIYNNLFINSAQNIESLYKIAEQLYVSLPSVYSAEALFQISLDSPLQEPIIIGAKSKVSNLNVTYEFLKSKNNYYGDIIIPANTLSTNIKLFAGVTKQLTEKTTGESGQQITIADENIVTDSIFVSVIPPDIEINAQSIIFHRIKEIEFRTELSNDFVFLKKFNPDGSAIITLSDNNFHKPIPADYNIVIDYRTSNGSFDNIPINFINTSVNVITLSGKTAKINIANISPGVGGKDKPTIEEIKTLIPDLSRKNKNLITVQDYESEIRSINGVSDVFVVDHHLDTVIYNGKFKVPFNSIFIYVLPESLQEIDPDLRTIINFTIESKKLLALDYFVFDANIQRFSILANVFISNTINIVDIYDKIQNEIKNTFSKPKLNNSISRSKIISVIQNVDGVEKVELLQPAIDLNSDENTALVLDNITLNIVAL